VKIAIAGAHGQIARPLARSLVGRGESVIGLIRNPDHTEDLRADGSQPVVCDLESAGPETVGEAIAGADVVVFAAGAGPGSGAARKLTMDRDGAVKLIDAARRAGVGRYVMVSAVGAGDPPAGDDVMSVYLRAKAEADDALAASELDWTILRPGGLTNDPGTGRVRIDRETFRGRVARADVAAVIEAVLFEPRSSRAILYVNGGDDAVPDALERALAAV
jgi:nucleoside-diphosphate-sugar epimerase